MEGDLVVKNLGQTRWSACADAIRALKNGFSKIKHALETIEEATSLKADTRRESEGLLRKMDQLEYGIHIELWSTIMERFHLTSKALQSATLDINGAVNMLQSLKAYVE